MIEFYDENIVCDVANQILKEWGISIDDSRCISVLDKGKYLAKLKNQTGKNNGNVQNLEG